HTILGTIFYQSKLSFGALPHPREAHIKETKSLLRLKIKFLGKETSFKLIVVFRFRLLVVVRCLFFFFSF
ncbi:hypothetical protein ACMBCN_01610, partial [Candidatus Liberibacter asiaticus]|nr:hypothetical protein [Candidatus Liberibacter asiaticus]